MNKINIIVVSVLSLLLLISIIAGVSSTMFESVETVSYPNNCSSYVDSAGSAMTFVSSISTAYCINSSGVASSQAISYFKMPLSGLFTANGAVMLIVMAALLLFAIVLVLKKMKES